MALGDGIRRNILKVSPEERERFIQAIIKLNGQFFPGSRTDIPAGHVSFWFKQDEIHQATHVHGSRAFLPWHRELINRFEEMLRSVDRELSLHYWDWNQDPEPLFSNSLFGSPSGAVGQPLLGAGFYDPTPVRGKYRDDQVHQRLPSGGYAELGNPADPPVKLERYKQRGAPRVGKKEEQDTSYWPTDDEFLQAGTFPQFNMLMHGPELVGQGLDPDPDFNGAAHGLAHTYIGGNLEDPHISFRDPFVFLLHSNVDRLWASWQIEGNHLERLDPATAYGDWGSHSTIDESLQPWAGASQWPVRPWAEPENETKEKTSKDISVVRPARYWPEIARVAIPEAKYESVVVAFKDLGYRPIWVNGYEVNGDNFFNLIVRPADGVKWVARHGLTGDEYQAELDKWKEKGYRPLHVDSYVRIGAVRYACIFTNQPGSWQAYHGKDQDEHQALFDDWTADGWRPSIISVTRPILDADPGPPRYTAVYHKTDVGSYFIRSRIHADKYQELFDENKQANRQLVYLKAWSNWGSVRFSAIWQSKVDFTVPSTDRHRLSLDAYAEKAKEHANSGKLTRMLTGYESGDNHKIGAQWVNE